MASLNQQQKDEARVALVDALGQALEELIPNSWRILQHRAEFADRLASVVEAAGWAPNKPAEPEVKQAVG